MLDLGFLEDVEKILALTPTAGRPRCSARRCRRRSASSPTATSTTRSSIKVEAATLTVDTVEQFPVEVKPADKAAKLAEVLEAERPDQAIVFVRTKIRCDQLYRKLRDKGMNVKALHGDMIAGLARRRDALVQGRPPADPRRHRRRRARPRHLDGHPRHQLRRPDLARRLRAPHRAHGARRAQSGRAITFVEPRQKRELEAIERHIGTSIAPWERGRAHRRRPRSRERPRRHSKPHVRATADEPYAQAHRQRRARRRPRGRRPRARGDRGDRARRRGRPRRQAARALRASSPSRPTRSSASSSEVDGTTRQGRRAAARAGARGLDPRYQLRRRGSPLSPCPAWRSPAAAGRSRRSAPPAQPARLDVPAHDVHPARARADAAADRRGAAARRGRGSKASRRGRTRRRRAPAISAGAPRATRRSAPQLRAALRRGRAEAATPAAAAAGDRVELERRALTAAGVAPPDAPGAVQRIVAAANQVARLPYVYGGGHGARAPRASGSTPPTTARARCRSRSPRRASEVADGLGRAGALGRARARASG